MAEIYPNRVTYLPEEIAPGYCALVPAEPDFIVCESVGTYIARSPEKTVLYGVVAGHLETFLAGNGSETGWCRASWNRSCTHS